MPTLMEALRLESIDTRAAPGSKEEALSLIADLACASGLLGGISREVILDGLRNREALGSTGFGDGIAIPHCRLDDVDEFVVGILGVPDGVDFEALDGNPVRVLVFIIAPSDESNDHIRLLSAISQVLSQEDAIREILADESAEATREHFLRRARCDVETRGHDSKNLFHVFITREDLFEDILKVFVSVQAAAVTVLDSHGSSEYLAKMPLFAGFWNDDYLGFSRMIVAVVEKAMSNEAIRRIDQIAGALDESSDVQLTVQDVFYASGSLAR